jgi:signal peptidase I
MAKSDNKQRKPQAAPPSAAAPLAPQTSRPGLPACIRWLLSKRVRQATAMRKHVQKLLNHQRDILTPQAIEAVEAAVAGCRKAVADNADNAALDKQMENLENVAGKWIKPYPSAAWRENVEVLLVALTVAMGIRTFFLQPFKIPTGSMQPTLFGVTSENLIDKPNYKMPTGLARVREWFAGTSYIHLVAENDGPVELIERPFPSAIFHLWQKVVAGGKTFMIWFPPDYGAPPSGTLEARAGIRFGYSYHKGEDIVKLKVSAGDHLFVDRLTYNFRPPERGEIIVFETKGIDNLPPDQFYIKRLVGLGGETLSLKEDYQVVGSPSFGTVPVGHLVVNGQPLSAATPHFENLYSFSGAHGTNVLQYKDGNYYGHALVGRLAPGATFQVRPDHLFVMGDNTMNSLDSRYWGDFPSRQVIGKSFFVYWPITERFGWGNR